MADFSADRLRPFRRAEDEEAPIRSGISCSDPATNLTTRRFMSRLQDAPMVSADFVWWLELVRL
jgi:hypothetical protein